MHSGAFKTKKAAREAGFRTHEDWLKTVNNGSPKTLVPRLDLTPIMVKDKAFFEELDCEEMVSRPEGKRRNLVISKDAEIAAYKQFRHTRAPLYRLSDYIPSKPRNERPAETIDVLLATFTVNKVAICGQLAGAYWGESGIPYEWREGLAKKEMIEPILTKLLQEA